MNLFPFTLVSLHLICCDFSYTLSISPNLYKLQILEIRNCLKLGIKKEGDQELRKLKEGNLPPLLSLAIHGCHSMLSLHLILDYPSLMSEVQVTNCNRLMYIEALRDLINLETMTFIDCPQLLLDLLDIVPECVVIS